MDHAAIVEGLLDPEAYPHPVDEVVHLQTHISSILLTGDRAYKLKKPVDFGFLNFSTLALRELNCRREVVLNSRLAPDVYLGVEPVRFDGERMSIGDGDGEIVDWVVVMEQLDGDHLGVGVLERGGLTRDMLDDLVEILVPFYEDARQGPDVDAFGEIAAIKFNTDENFAQTDNYIGKLISRDRFEHIQNWTNRFFAEHKELFERRIDEGRIRECHGDLHLDNIFFCDPPIVFDCIEFNDRLACGDVAMDIGFLAMDLDARGRPDLSQHFVDRFVDASGDEGLHKLMDFYKAYRAYVRAKVAAFTSEDPDLDHAEQRRNRNAARRSFGLAYRYAGGSARPPLVVFYGLMGTGKSSLSRYLREVYGWHIISTDEVRKQISGVGEATRVWVPYGTGLYSAEMNERTYVESCRRAGDLIDAGLPVAIDGAFKTAEQRQVVMDMAREHGGNVRFVETVCEPDAQRRRLEARQVYDTRSDGRIELMERQRNEFESPPVDVAHLFRELPTDGPVADTRERLVAYLRELDMLEARPR
jgi:aminoglycoside phosphotransferase family enzyme/predicted kinase